MATWTNVATGSTYGNIKMDIDIGIRSVTRTSNTNVRVVYGVRFKPYQWTYNSVCAWTPSGGTKRYAFNSNSGASHTQTGTWYYANTGSGTTSETCPFTIDLTVGITQTSASFRVGVDWNWYNPSSESGSYPITVTFPTGATAPTGLSCSVSNVTETSCTLSGSYSSDGNATVTATGFQYKTESGSWTNCSSTLTGLSANTKYYFRYYATNSQGTSYSDGTTNTTTYNYPYIVSITTSNLEIGSAQTLNIYNPLKRACTIYMKKDSTSGTQLGSLSITTSQGSGNYNLTPNSSTMYNSIPSAQEGNCVYYIISSNPSHTSATISGKYKIKGTEVPNFSDSNWSYSADKTNLTKTNQCIIKSYSTVSFTVNTAATSSYGATIVKYVYKWGTQSKDSTSGNTVTGGNNNILQVDAVDSRGLIRSTQKTLTSGDKYVPYNLPSLDYSNCYTHRTDGILIETKLTLRGNLSVMKFGTSGVANALNSVKYRVYDYSTGKWSSQFTIPVGSFTLQSSGYFSLSNYPIHANGSSGGFTTGKRYAVQIILKDAAGSLGTLNSSNILVTDGKIARDVYQDSNGNYHQGINGMADSDYTEKIYGNEYVDGNIQLPNEKNKQLIKNKAGSWIDDRDIAGVRNNNNGSTDGYAAVVSQKTKNGNWTIGAYDASPDALIFCYTSDSDYNNKTNNHVQAILRNSGGTIALKSEVDAKAPTSHASSGTTYGVGTASNYGHCRVINNLTTSSATNGYALQAYQGKVLKDLIDALTTKLNNIGTGIRVYNSNTQNIPSKTATTLVFNTVDYKTNNNLTLSSNKIKIGAGINYVLVNARWSAWSASSNGRYIYLYKNNDNTQYAFENSQYTGTMQTSCVIPVAEGDYIYAGCYQETSGTITTSNTKTQTFMEVIILG